MLLLDLSVYICSLYFCTLYYDGMCHTCMPYCWLIQWIRVVAPGVLIYTRKNIIIIIIITTGRISEDVPRCNTR